MKLKSDAIPGSGTSLAGIIDRDVAYDKYGLPYIPAKRIKGVLKESAEDLRIPKNQIKDIFGIGHNKKGVDLRIDNGYLKNHQDYRELLQKESMNTFLPNQSVLDYFTYTRSQTTIEEGVAKENSLRVSRVLKKGLEFEFDIQCNTKHIEDLKQICKVTRSFGSSRTRGFGEIELSFDESKTNNNALTEIQFDSKSDILSKMKITVENIQQLLLTSTPGKSQVSDDYINGSSVLGALAWNYHKQNGVDEKFSELFLSGKISFGNLYPIKKDGENNYTYYPSPLSVKKVKEVKNGNYQSDYYDHALTDDVDIFENIIFKGGLTGHTTTHFQNKIGIIKNVEAHHRRDENRHIAKSTKKGSGDFFQFEVIEQGQAFSGEIIGQENLLSELGNYFPENGKMWFGKSKTGQYGKCNISWDKSIITNAKFEWDAGETEMFIFRSDMILLNKNGFAVADVNLFISELAQKLGVDSSDLKLVNQFSKTVNVGGFMGVWKMPRIQKSAIATGTVVVLKNNTGKTIEAEKIETMFFGDRIEDGFGRIDLYENEETEVSTPIEEEIKPSKLTEIDESVKDLVIFHQKKIIKRGLTKKAIKKANDERVNNSFIGKIISFLKVSKSFKEFEEKIGELKSDKQKKNLGHITEGLIIDKIEIIMDTFNDMVLQTQKEMPIKIPKLESNFEFYKHYTLAFLTQVKFNNRGGK